MKWRKFILIIYMNTSKDLNNYNDVDDESEFDITYDNYFINSSIDGNADDILNSAITEDEIRIAIKDLKNNKASGTGVSKFF